MKTIIVNIPEKEESFFLSLLKKFHFKSHVLSDKSEEERKIAQWIDDGMNSEEVSEEVCGASEGGGLVRASADRKVGGRAEAPPHLRLSDYWIRAGGSLLRWWPARSLPGRSSYRA